MLSMRGPRPAPVIGDTVKVAELALHVDRSRRIDIAIKSLVQFFWSPVIAWHLRRFKADAFYMPDIIPLLPLLLHWFSGVPVASSYGDWHIHNKLEKRSWAGPLVAFAEWLERLEARKVDFFTCRAKSAQRRLEAFGVPSDRVRTFHDAPDLSAFNPHDESALRAKCGFKPDDVVLLYHGVMHQGKGLDLLINWTADLYAENPAIGLILVGAGPETDALKALAAARGIEKRTVFTGWLETTQEVGNYCNAADICIAMRTGAESNIHIIPGALLHSMACRKVVLGPDLPGIVEIIQHGKNGFTFKADDGDSFRDLIRKLARERAGWPAIAEAAYRQIQDEFSIPATARQYAGALEYFARFDGRANPRTGGGRF
jgi:glycosyltransferase involved in cell wall biosynthesis